MDCDRLAFTRFGPVMIVGRLSAVHRSVLRTDPVSVTADEQHRLSRTLLRQTHDLRALETLYDTQQREVGRLRAEIASFQEPSDPGVAPDPVVVRLESQIRQHEAEFRNLKARFDQAVSERDVLQDQSDHLAEEVRLAGDEIEQLQEDRNDLDRARENAEYELLLTETSLTRATEALQQAESRAARPVETSGEAFPDLDRLTQERDAAQAAAIRAGDQLGAFETEIPRGLMPLAFVGTSRISMPNWPPPRKHGGVPTKELEDAKHRLQDLEYSVRVLQRERDAARDARDQARRERDLLQRDLDAARGRLSAVAVAVGSTSVVDVGASGPAAVLHSLRDQPVDPPTENPNPSVGSQGQASSGSNAPPSPPRPKRPRSSPVSSESSPTPPAKRRVVPLSPDGEDHRGSKSSAEGSGASPVDLTQDDGHLADDDRGVSDASDADSDASSDSHASGASHGKKDAEAGSGSDEEEDEDAAEVADDLLEAQTLQALAQSRSAERWRRQASPRR
ncbi:hypothetical protein PR003_g30775, partial [Phytophthora rubi]